MSWFVSVDDHVIEPPHVWQSRLPAKHREAGPRIIDVDGNDVWLYAGKRKPIGGLSAFSGREKGTASMDAINYADMREGAFDAHARLADMDLAGIAASMSFPSFPRFCGQEFLEASDKELSLLCVRAYNDWMIEEWCATAPDRFIPIIIVPLWDPQLAADEVRRCAEMGNRAITFSEQPEALGLPTIWDSNGHWDPLWGACDETQTVVCMHIGSSSQILTISKDTPYWVSWSWGASARVAATMIDWLFAPVFRRFPGVKIALSEGGIGWMPYFLERAEQVIENQGSVLAAGTQFGSDLSAERGLKLEVDESKKIDVASIDLRQTFKDHVYGCFINDLHGVLNIHSIGVENVMLESDYPHSDSLWPDCITHLEKQLAANPALTTDEKKLLLRGNAERVFRFTARSDDELTRGKGA